MASIKCSVTAHQLARARCFLDQSIQGRHGIQRLGPDSGG